MGRWRQAVEALVPLLGDIAVDGRRSARIRRRVRIPPRDGTREQLEKIGDASACPGIRFLLKDFDERVQVEAESRDGVRRFLGSGSAYTPRPRH